MRSRKTLCSFLLMLCLILAMTVAAAADETSETEKTGTSATDSSSVSGTVYLRKKGNSTYLYYTDTNKAVKNYTGIKQIPSGSGNYYFFLNSKGKILVNRLFTIGEKKYYVGEDGKLAVGFRTVNGITYYFRAHGLYAVSGWLKSDGKWYYFNENCILQKGFAKINNYVYYLNPSKGGARTTGWKKVSGNVYYFNAKGRMKTGFLIINGKRYYMNSSGIRQTGLQNINGKIYYFSKYGVMKTGSLKINGKYYFFSSSSSNYGQAQCGWVMIGSNKYYYGTISYTRLMGKWITETKNGKEVNYYLSATTGAMVTGKQTIDGKSYVFNSDGTLESQSSSNVNPDWRKYTPTKIRINLTTNVITVYSGSVALRSFYCCTSADGGAKTYAALHGKNIYLRDKLRWHELDGPSWGQYCEHLTDSILFHSVPYTVQNNPYSLYPSTFNLLGQYASHGCIRLACIDAYYIYTYCPVGTPVYTDYYGYTDPLTPVKYTADSSSSYCVDPTDPVYANGLKYLD